MSGQPDSTWGGSVSAQSVISDAASAESGEGEPPEFKVLDLAESARRLRMGLPLIIPTDTIMGLGVAVNAAPTPADLFAIKRRDPNKPIAWLIADAEDMHKYGEDIPLYADFLAEAFWPDGLTLIVRASDEVPDAYLSERNTIALRVPDSDEVRQLIREAESPVATTSANISGMRAAITAEELDPAILKSERHIFATSSRPTGLASTIIDCTGEAPVILRVGDVTVEDVMAVCSDAGVELDAVRA